MLVIERQAYEPSESTSQSILIAYCPMVVRARLSDTRKGYNPGDDYA
jgi:hypothetical protein